MLKETPFSVIKFDEDQENKILVHRSEITDFNIGSVLVVNDSQQAILFKDGVAEGPFPGGRHILTTNNIPTFREKFARFFSFGKEKLEDRVTPFTSSMIWA